MIRRKDVENGFGLVSEMFHLPARQGMAGRARRGLYAEELRAWHEKSGLPLRRFFNTSGLLYKGMALKDKLPEMTDNEQYILLGEYGMLVKRPLIVADDFVLVGFREAEWSAALG